MVCRLIPFIGNLLSSSGGARNYGVTPSGHECDEDEDGVRCGTHRSSWQTDLACATWEETVQERHFDRAEKGGLWWWSPLQGCGTLSASYCSRFALVQVQNVIDFDKIEEQQWAFEGTNVGFCELGATRGQVGKVCYFWLDFVNIAIWRKDLSNSTTTTSSVRPNSPRLPVASTSVWSARKVPMRIPGSSTWKSRYQY
jgi:hypothetical protein